jgi:hypothetical protein
MAMLYPELAVMLTRLREVLNNIIEERRKNVVEELEKVEWTPLPESKPSYGYSVAAVDSSFVLIESRVFPIYVIQGISQVYVFDRDKIVAKAANRFYDAGVMEFEKKGPVRRSDLKKALTMYAYFLELKSMQSILKSYSADVALFDGSFLSFMLTRKDIAKAVKLRSIEGEVKLEDVVNDKLDLIEKLVESFVTAFIAKSSFVNFYKLGYADFQLFELAKIHGVKPHNEPGYSKPVDVSITSDLLKFLGLKATAIRGFLVTYTRFGKGSQVFQLSVPYVEKKPDITILVSCLRAFSPAGYPLPLETVHRLSKLSKKALKGFLSKIGVPTLSGREILEIS